MIARPFAEIASLGTAVPPGVLTNADLTRDARHLRRVDRRADRHPRAADRRRPEQSVAMLSPRGQRACARAARASPPRRSTRSSWPPRAPDRLLPSTACDLQALLGAEQRGRLRHRRRLPGLRLRAHRGRGTHRLGAEPHRARRRRGEAFHHHRFQGPVNGDPLRRWRGSLDRSRLEQTGRGILSTFIKSDGRLAPLLYRPGGGSADPISERVVCERSHYMKMAGREVFKAAVLAMADACDEALKRAGVRRTRSTCWCRTRPTSGSSRPRPSMPASRCRRSWSTSIATGTRRPRRFPLALDQALSEGRVGPGSLLLFVAFGAGFTWGSAVVRW